MVRKSTLINNIITPFIPTFHILIATGGRPSLLNMLNSLKFELTINDAITIIFDGEGALEKSTFSEKWLEGHKSKINIIEQKTQLGFWGHGIRNQYQGTLNPETTFILNADDDDIYKEGSFAKLRQLCSDKNTLYIAKFFDKKKNVYVPSQNYKIELNDIGTPCGIIPFSVANKSIWGLKYGGDFDYYDKLKSNITKIKFLDIVIYEV
jgi:hypothetical protein